MPKNGKAALVKDIHIESIRPYVKDERCKHSWERAVDFFADGRDSGPVSIFTSCGVFAL
jgi:hypothetical protein